MKFFIDSANVEEIKAIQNLGVLSGVTTNPSLVAKEGVSFHKRLKEITSIVSGSVSAEVISEDAEGMIKEGRRLASIAPNVTIKVPMTADGLQAVKTFHEEGITTNVTLIFNANQALLAARAGATYVSPFLGRLDDIGYDGIQLVSTIVEMFDIHNINTKIIAASIRHSLHVLEAAQSGAHIATIPHDVFYELIQHPLTDQGIEQFLSDWKEANLD